MSNTSRGPGDACTNRSHASPLLPRAAQKEFFWWEPLESLRRLGVTGFVLLLPDDARRLFAATLLSAAFLLLLAFLRAPRPPAHPHPSPMPQPWRRCYARA